MGRPVTYCTVDGCPARNFGRGLCHRHYGRVRRRGTTELAPRPRHDFADAKGYIRRYVDGRRQAQYVHRLVMEATLGRELRPNESVHHRNSRKADNRPENLELWVRWQPTGCRVEDLVSFAREVLELYG